MVEDAIKGLVTKSANDAAVVISESIGGTEGEFAALMTQKAKALGMASTNYVNASGLPDHKQITTARDQVILARAIQDRFPSYYRFFATRSFRYNGVVLHNSNSLLAQVKGIDGIKTGYTKASGYNLVVSVRRNGKHIVMVMLGGTSKAARDARMRELIENHIIHASSIEGADAFALSPTPALVEVQPPATEPQEESQQKEASQTTSDQEKSSSNAEPVKSQESAALLNGAWRFSRPPVRIVYRRSFQTRMQRMTGLPLLRIHSSCSAPGSAARFIKC
jgi:D-alanyl-D-alanine carboxypeptidase